MRRKMQKGETDRREEMEARNERRGRGEKDERERMYTKISGKWEFKYREDRRESKSHEKN